MRRAILAATLAGAACAGAPEGTARVELDLPEQAARLADRGLAKADLFGDDQVTVALLRIVEAVPPHRHERSDETIYLLSGAGVLHLGSGDRELRAGDFFVLPRGTTHAFTPSGKEPVVALQLFAPRFVEGDRIPATLPR